MELQSGYCEFETAFTPSEILYRAQCFELFHNKLIPNTFISSQKNHLFKTDRYLSKHYRGINHGSSRHLIHDSHILKGIGKNPLTYRTDSKHSDGRLKKEECLREFLLAQMFKDLPFMASIPMIGRFDQDNYFLVREHYFPRLAQFDEDNMPECLLYELKQKFEHTNVIALIFNNIFAPFKHGLHHLSFNLENLNILGQYLDVGSFEFQKQDSVCIFISTKYPKKNTLNHIRETLEILLQFWSRIKGSELKIEQFSLMIADQLEMIFQPQDLNQVFQLFWEKCPQIGFTNWKRLEFQSRSQVPSSAIHFQKLYQVWNSGL